MDEYETLNHTTWDCKYHVGFIPKYRRKALFRELSKPLGEVFRQLAAQKEAQVEEGHLLPDQSQLRAGRPSQGLKNCAPVASKLAALRVTIVIL